MFLSHQRKQFSVTDFNLSKQDLPFKPYLLPTEVDRWRVPQVVHSRPPLISCDHTWWIRRVWTLKVSRSQPLYPSDLTTWQTCMGSGGRGQGTLAARLQRWIVMEPMTERFISATWRSSKPWREKLKPRTLFLINLNADTPLCARIMGLPAVTLQQMLI